MKNRGLQTFEQLLAAMNRHDAVAAAELNAEDVVFWEPSYAEPRRGREAVRRELEGFFALLPDIHFTPETIFVDGDHALCEWSYRATYQGRPIALRECAVGRLDADGRLAEVRIYFDRFTLLRQLGLLPSE